LTAKMKRANKYSCPKTTLRLEHAIKEGPDFDEVRKLALDSTLLVRMGNETIAEIPLNKKE